MPPTPDDDNAREQVSADLSDAYQKLGLIDSQTSDFKTFNALASDLLVQEFFLLDNCRIPSSMQRVATGFTQEAANGEHVYVITVLFWRWPTKNNFGCRVTQTHFSPDSPVDGIFLEEFEADTMDGVQTSLRENLLKCFENKLRAETPESQSGGIAAKIKRVLRRVMAS